MAFVSSSPSPRPIASATSSRPYLRANSSSRARSSLEGCVDLIASLLRFSQWSDQVRSEEHTSELQSQSNIVCRLLLEKKKAYITEIVAHPDLYHPRNECAVTTPRVLPHFTPYSPDPAAHLMRPVAPSIATASSLDIPI